jgi:hypothetical protein
MGMQTQDPQPTKKAASFAAGEDMFNNVLDRMKKWFGDSI